MGERRRRRGHTLPRRATRPPWARTAPPAPSSSRVTAPRRGALADAQLNAHRRALGRDVSESRAALPRAPPASARAAASSARHLRQHLPERGQRRSGRPGVGGDQQPAVAGDLRGEHRLVVEKGNTPTTMASCTRPAGHLATLPPKGRTHGSRPAAHRLPDDFNVKTGGPAASGCSARRCRPPCKRSILRLQGMASFARTPGHLAKRPCR
jgi:hypothetical protein